MTEEALLLIRDLELAYDGVVVLSGVNLEIRRGEFWFLLGPNGSGKTTLMKAILGLLSPRGGVLEHGPLARSEIAFVPQQCALNPGIPTTVREFVSLGFIGTANARDERAQRLVHALERVGLKGMAERSYWEISGGQQQRALVARALVRAPRFLLLDEPTEALDIGSEETLLETLEELRRTADITLVFITHELEIAARHASHVALFQHGRVRSGPRREILNAQALQEAYGVAPALAEKLCSGAARVKTASTAV